MIVSAEGPLARRFRGLRSLYVSLNSPVVTLAALPVGPATALVAVHGSPVAGATLAVCSARTGTVAFYTVADAGDPASGADLAAQTALSFAESLGFLFDEALDPAEAPAEVLARWEAWVGEAATDDGAPARRAEAPAPALSKFRLPLAGAGRELACAVESALRSAAPVEPDPPTDRTSRP